MKIREVRLLLPRISGLIETELGKLKLNHIEFEELARFILEEGLLKTEGSVTKSYRFNNFVREYKIQKLRSLTTAINQDPEWRLHNNSISIVAAIEHVKICLIKYDKIVSYEAARKILLNIQSELSKVPETRYLSIAVRRKLKGKKWTIVYEAPIEHHLAKMYRNGEL
ncbi:hypothetical protein ACFL0K_00680 [Patescibacteria group bacterium]